MYFDDEYNKRIEREVVEQVKKEKEYEKEIDRIIKEDYNEDEDQYYKDTFNMLGAMLLTGLGIDEIRKILLDKLPLNSDRRKILIESMDKSTMKERMIYPGGYNSYLEDLYNGYYGRFNEGCGII